MQNKAIMSIIIIKTVLFLPGRDEVELCWIVLVFIIWPILWTIFWR